MKDEKLKGKKILLVDDDKFLINMYAMKFTQEGFIVESCTSGKETLERLRETEKPDVILLDIVMPSMDGIELLSIIRKEKLADDAKIIILSNQSQESDIEKAKSLGIAGYIVKATSIPSEVVTDVEDILSKVK